ncbi:glycosyltransferase [Staphylococcus massiliensis]|uniref:Glycoside hydrolase n=1 Tax=Staphylococcus massiliensis S46 TaxID=1229783 RepID=K9AKA4_9STAP|nr:glycosyltransferase [Staphylococcus massiliensis]EKU47773.1 glycoside hydrolase [Staphylococcus massiliensis S46]PNZ98039.1 glycosyl transferase [Staphylococcus massiliensis CCUG 55927]
MKKVGMFVWNHFTNDARVNRECTALSDNGYNVDLIAINDPKNKMIQAYEKVNERFRVHRVKRYPWLLQTYQDQGKRFLIVIGGIATAVAIGLFFVNFMLLSAYLMVLVAGAASIKVRKFRKMIVNSAIIMRMIVKGYRLNADIYHSNDLNTLPQGIVCSKLRLKPRPLIYDSHEVQSDRTGYNPEKIKKIERFLLRFVDIMMVENHTRAKHNEKLYGFCPDTLYNYSELYDIEKRPKVDLHERLGLEKDTKILLYQGGLQKGRGLELLIKAMPKIKEGVLVFIGAGKLTEPLKAQAKTSSESSRIFFIDKVPFKELPSYTREAYLGYQVLQNVCFNHYSASSNKLFEYIMAHVPVVGCSFPEVEHVINETQVGLAIDSHSVDAIADATNRLIEDQALYESCKSNTYDAKHIYNWNNEKAKLLDVYDRAQAVQGKHLGMMNQYV